MQYGFIPLKDIVNNYELMYVGEDKLIVKIDRSEIIFHAKRGLQNIHYNIFSSVKGLELELGDDLRFNLPEDFVNIVRISWLGEDGRLRPMMPGRDSANGITYLQDINYNILTDHEGNKLQGTPISLEMFKTKDTIRVDQSAISIGSQYNFDTRQNANGQYLLNRELGYIDLSTHASGKQLFLEYVSDGLNHIYEEISVHKLAETYLYDYIDYQLLKRRYGISQADKERARKQHFASSQNTKITFAFDRMHELTQHLKGGNAWVR